MFFSGNQRPKLLGTPGLNFILIEKLQRTMISDPETHNASVSDGTPRSTHDSSVLESQNDVKEKSNLNRNEFLINEQLQNLTDKVLSLSQISQLPTYLTDILPQYLSSITEILKAKKSYSEPETVAFFIHF